MKRKDWISVENKLPELTEQDNVYKWYMSEIVLVTNGDSIYESFLLKTNGDEYADWSINGIDEESGFEVDYQITHWMKIILP